ncbi:MAG: hypothetical protein AVDCRST_MAG11-3798 [uncultured Gemmatimonadaceae bacterium]|uniref:Uncharacterized protein n=1 Tax=uncultured Gemmatimonadaceae bacterium TaxID=246130 RepID=A0A6J4MDG6_9BACT|nr:MAG: hypothetical protein AVDCRST_MAG11-3798 [uncultured Gemmatimonadaceae bacterium]
MRRAPAARHHPLHEQLRVEVVRERVPVGARLRHRRDHARAQPVLERRHELGLRGHLDVERELEVELAAEDRRGRERAPRLERQRGEPPLHEVDHRRGERHRHRRLPLPPLAGVPHRAAVDEGAQHLHRDQRVPLGAPEQVRHEPAAHVLPVEHRLHPAAQLVPREAPEGDLAEQGAARDALPPHEGVAAQLLAPHGEDHEHPLGVERGHDGLQRVPRLGRGPLHVLQGDGERPRRAREAQEERQLLEQRVAVERRAGLRGGVRRERRRDARELAPRARRLNRASAVHRPHHVAPGRVGEAHVGLDAPAAREEPGAQAQVGLELLHERRLPHAGLAGDHHEPRVPAGRLLHVAGEQAQLGDAPDELLDLGRARGGREVGAGRRAGGPVAAGALRLVEGAVGGGEQRLGAVAVVGERGDAHAHRDGDRARPVAQREDVRAHRRADPLGDVARAGRRGVGEEGDELVAGVARRHVSGAQRPAQQVGDAHQDVVALQVAVAVVDVLEVVHVDDEQRHRRRRAARPLDRGRGRLEERAAQRQPGEVVGPWSHAGGGGARRRRGAGGRARHEAAPQNATATLRGVADKRTRAQVGCSGAPGRTREVSLPEPSRRPAA